MLASRLVPALAALVLAQQAFAAVVALPADGIAPVSVLPSDDALLSATVFDVDNVDPRAALDLAALAASSYDYRSATGWSDFDALGVSSSAGIAVVALSGAGTWQYDLGSGWNNLPSPAAVDGDHAIVLPFAGARLRFVPSTLGAATATLTFRLWDGSDGASSGSEIGTGNPDPLSGLVYGGSPTAYSADTRTLTVTVADNTGNTGAPSIYQIDGVDGDGILQARDGFTSYLNVYADDPDAGDVLAWSVSASGYVGYVEHDGYVDVDYDPDINNYPTDNIQVIVTDLNGNSQTILVPVVVTANIDPTLTYDGPVDINGDPSPPLSVNRGDTITLPFTAFDGNNDLLTWMMAASDFGTVTQDATGVHYTPEPTGTGDLAVTLTITVDDGYGGTATVTLPISVLGATAQPPQIDQVVNGYFAIVGQPFEAVVRVSDPDSAVDALVVTASEPGATATQLPGGVWRLTWTPASTSFEHGVAFTVTDPDDLSGSSWIYLDYVAAPTPASLPASLPLSTPDNIVYGAIAPGYQGGFSLLGSFLDGQTPATARAFWWSIDRYRELPGSVADPQRNGVFLASTVPTGLVFAPPTQPAPFAITLRAGEWAFFGIPPLLLDTYGGSETVHPWADIELQEIDGTPVDFATKLAALAPAGGTTDADTQPFAWRWDLQPAAYQRADSLDSGTAYWLRNRLGRDLRLVRTPGAQVVAAAMPASKAAAKAVATADLPPAPPSGGKKATPAAADGGCGAGGLAGLLLACLALLGLRPRRRG